MPAARSSSSLAPSSRWRSGGEPNAPSSFAHIDRAAATLTCWPTIVRSKVWAPGSLLRGSGTPMLLDDAGEGGLTLGERLDGLADACGRCGPSGDARGVKRDRRGVGDVQAFHRIADRQASQRVAMLAGVVAQARPFGAEHQGDARRPERLGELVSASPASPIRQKPASPISSSARARLTTRAHGTRSSAPEAALATTPLSGGEWRS